MVQRKVEHTTTGDIYDLGYTIVNQMATKDVDKIFSNKSDFPEDTDAGQEVTKLAELFLIVINLLDKVKKLENEVTVLQGDNADLRVRLEVGPTHQKLKFLEAMIWYYQLITLVLTKPKHFEFF